MFFQQNAYSKTWGYRPIGLCKAAVWLSPSFDQCWWSYSNRAFDNQRLRKDVSNGFVEQRSDRLLEVNRLTVVSVFGKRAHEGAQAVRLNDRHQFEQPEVEHVDADSQWRQLSSMMTVRAFWMVHCKGTLFKTTIIQFVSKDVYWLTIFT